MDIVVGDGRFSCDSFHVWLSVCPDWCGRKRTLNRVIIPVQSIIIENRRGVSFVCFFEQVRLYYFIGFSFVFLFFFCFVVVFFCFRLHTFVLLTGGNRNIQQWCVCVCVWEREVCYDDIVGETWTVHWKWFFFQRKVNDKGAREIGLRGRDKQLNTKEKKLHSLRRFKEALAQSNEESRVEETDTSRLTRSVREFTYGDGNNSHGSKRWSGNVDWDGQRAAVLNFSVGDWSTSLIKPPLLERNGCISLHPVQTTGLVTGLVWPSSLVTRRECSRLVEFCTLIGYISRQEPALTGLVC